MVDVLCVEGVGVVDECEGIVVVELCGDCKVKFDWCVWSDWCVWLWMCVWGCVCLIWCVCWVCVRCEGVLCLYLWKFRVEIVIARRRRREEEEEINVGVKL